MYNQRKWQLQGDLKSLLYPYGFILKEGKNHNSDPFDFDLVLLQFKVTERLNSPKQRDTSLQKLAHALAEKVRKKRKEESLIPPLPPLYALEQEGI
jgi:hypothetical protein